MYFTDYNSIPLRRQHHDHKGGLFSPCQRKYVKWRYLFCSKASFTISTLIWSVVGVLTMAFIVSTNIKQNIFMDTSLPEMPNNYNINERLKANYSTKERVYKTLESWQLSAHSDINKLPKLSSMRDDRWKHYPSDQLFDWIEKPFNFVDERLKLLDIENQKEFGYYSKEYSKYGDLGAPIELKGNLREESSAKFSTHQIDVVASNVMSLNRRLQEVRNPK